jgi:hypothetical protein
MSGGSTEPDSPRDRQCRHCGLYFSASGIVSHERNCDWEALPTTHPHADEIDEGEPAASDRFRKGGDPSGETPGETLSKPPESEGDPPVKGADPSDQEAEPDRASPRTDGGNPALDAPEPVEVSTDGGSNQEEGGAGECPSCGSDDYVDADAVLEQSDAEGRERALLANNDRVCFGCREVYSV